jgi:hypothetical protein
MNRLPIVLLICLALASCSKKQIKEAAGEGPNQDRAKLGDGSHAQIYHGPDSAAMPDWVMIYPGGHVTQVVFRQEQPSGVGGSVTYTTPATTDQIVTFYQQAARARGFLPSGTTPGREFLQLSTGRTFFISIFAFPTQPNLPTQVALVARENG